MTEEAEDTQDVNPFDVLLERMNEAIKSGVLNELICEVKSQIMMQGLRADGQYRTAPAVANDEFVLKGFRLGAEKRGQRRIIFEFRPVDPSGQFKQTELDDSKVFQAFPDLEPLIVRVLDFEPVDTDGNTVKFEGAKKAFVARVGRDLTKERKKREAERKRREQEAKEAEQRQEASHYESHPLYGLWG